METHFSGRMIQNLRPCGEIQDQATDRKGNEREIQDFVAEIAQRRIRKVLYKRECNVICCDGTDERPEFIRQ